jgi:hypothetical protein
MNGLPPFKFGRNHMKFKAALFLGGVVLIVVAPVWADRIPYPGTPKELPRIEISANVTQRTGTNTPVSAEFRAEATPIASLADSFEANPAFEARDLRPPTGLDTSFPSLSGVGSHHPSLRDFDSDQRVPSNWHAEKGWFKEGKGNGGNDTDKNEVKESIEIASAPEPGSLSLLLLGLIVVGFSARRRANLPLRA